MIIYFIYPDVAWFVFILALRPVATRVVSTPKITKVPETTYNFLNTDGRFLCLREKVRNNNQYYLNFFPNATKKPDRYSLAVFVTTLNSVLVEWEVPQLSISNNVGSNPDRAQMDLT